MSGKRCAVSVCSNSDEKSKTAGVQIFYHKFPKAQPYRNFWIQRCKRPEGWNPDSYYVCSIHFTKDDYRNENQTTSTPCKKKLKATAIPSLFLTKPLTSEVSPKRNRRIKFIDEQEDQYCLDNSNIQLPYSDYETLEETSDELTTYDSCFTDDSNEFERIHTSEHEYNFNTSSDSDYEESCDECRQKLLFVTVKDSSTQTEPDCLLENFNQLLNKNENLETEALSWRNKCKKLKANMRFLESEIQKLTLNSAQVK